MREASIRFFEEFLLGMAERSQFGLDHMGWHDSTSAAVGLFSDIGPG